MSRDAAVWTVLDLIRWTTGYFASKGIETARLDAECLLAHALGCERLRLYLDHDKPVLESERARYRDLVKRRAEDFVPVAYLTGTREFWSLPLRVTPDVLVPRPETETLVEAALGLVPAGGEEVRILDLGTGCGAVALALARERPAARLTATDVSAAALAVAEGNAVVLGFQGRVRFLCGDAFEPVRGERFDLVVSNPPYLGRGEWATPSVTGEAETQELGRRETAGLSPELAHEPEVALFAGPEGTELLRRIAAGAPAVLEPGGALALELAPHQTGDVTQCMVEAGFRQVRVHRDLAGHPRAVTGVRGDGRKDDGEPLH